MNIFMDIKDQLYTYRHKIKRSCKNCLGHLVGWKCDTCNDHNKFAPIRKPKTWNTKVKIM